MADQKGLSALPKKMRFLFDPKYWEKAMKKLIKIVEKVNSSQTGHSINVDALNKRDFSFLARFRYNVELFVDLIVALRWASSCKFIKDEEKIAKAVERVKIQQKRRIQRMEASELMDDLGHCDKWATGIYYYEYYDHLGIAWMHAGRWGQDYVPPFVYDFSKRQIYTPPIHRVAKSRPTTFGMLAPPFLFFYSVFFLSFSFYYIF